MNTVSNKTELTEAQKNEVLELRRVIMAGDYSAFIELMRDSDHPHLYKYKLFMLPGTWYEKAALHKMRMHIAERFWKRVYSAAWLTVFETIEKAKCWITKLR